MFRCGLHPKAQAYRYVWTKLQNTVNAYCKDAAIKVIEPSEPKNTIISENPSLIIQVENKELLEKFLDDYSAYFEDDALDSYNYDRFNFNRLDKQFEGLIGKFRISTDRNKILTKYYIDDTNYLPIILWGLRNECIGFKDIRFSLPPKEEELDRMPDIELRKRKLRNNGSDLSIIDFCITVDLSDFIRLRGLRKAETETKTKDKPTKIDLNKYKLNEREWKIFFCIKYAIDNASKQECDISIPKSLFIDTGALTKATKAKQMTEFNKKILGNTGRLNYKMNLITANRDDKTKSTYKINMLLYQEFNYLVTDEKGSPSLKKSYKTYEGFLDEISYKFTKENL